MSLCRRAKTASIAKEEYIILVWREESREIAEEMRLELELELEVVWYISGLSSPDGQPLVTPNKLRVADMN